MMHSTCGMPTVFMKRLLLLWIIIARWHGRIIAIVLIELIATMLAATAMLLRLLTSLLLLLLISCRFRCRRCRRLTSTAALGRSSFTLWPLQWSLLVTCIATSLLFLFVIGEILLLACRWFDVILPAGIATLLSHQIRQYNVVGVFGAWGHINDIAHSNTFGYNILFGVEANTVDWARYHAHHIEYLAQRAIAFVEKHHRVDVDGSEIRQRFDQH